MEKSFGVITTDKELNILSWNTWIENVSGKKFVRGEKLTELFPEIVERGYDKKLVDTLKSSNVTILSSTFHKYLIKCKPTYASKLFDVMQQSVTISPLHDGTQLIGLIIVIKDVTEEVEKSKLGLNEIKEGEKKDSTDLFIELGDKNWQKRKNAVEEISKSHHSILNEIVLRIKNEHKNLNVINSALQVLINTPAEVVDILIDLLNSDDQDLRIYAAQTMGEKNDPAIIEALINTIDDENQNVRYHVIESLGKLNATAAAGKILEIALQGDFFISFPAIDALKNIGDSTIAVKLLPLLKNEIFNSVVVETIGKIGDEKVVDKLCLVLNEDKSITSQICKSLVEIYDKYQISYDEGELISQIIKNNINQEGIKNIINALSSVDRKSKDLIAISKVLGWLEGEDVEKTLASLIHNDAVRDLIIESLIKLGNKVAPLLHKQMSAADSETKCAILTALGRIGDKESVDILIDSLDEYDEKICVTALGALAKIGDRSAFRPIIKLLGSESSIIRRAAISALNSIGHPEMENEVLKLLNDSNPLVRESAIRIAGYFGYPKCVEIVIRSCSDEEEIVRAAAIENLPFFEDKRVIRIISSALKVETAKCKIAAVKALAFVEGKQAVAILLKALKDEDPWVRINAIRSLVHHRSREAEDTIIEIIKKDNSIPVKINALEALGEIGGSSSVAILSEFVEDKNLDLAKAAIKSIGKLKVEGAVNPLLRLLKSYDEQKKIYAIESLSKKDDVEIIEAITWVALTDKEHIIRNASIESLCESGTENSINALIRLTNEKELRELVIRALSKQKKENIFVIARALEKSNSFVKTAIIDALSRMKYNVATEIIFTCLDDQDSNVRIAAIQALERIGNREQDKKIAFIAQNDPDPKVRMIANEYLKSNPIN